MLHLLIDYARRQGLVTEPGFKPKRVYWSVTCNLEGQLLGVTPLGGEAKGRPEGIEFARCPDLSQPEMVRAGAGCRHFLVDTADVVAQLSQEPDAEPDAKLAAKHAYFVHLLRQASQAVPDLPALAAAVRCLENPTNVAELRARLLEHKAKAIENVTFSVLDAEPTYPVDSPAWHPWWRTFRATLASPSGGGDAGEEEAPTMRCLASGELVVPVSTHPKIEGLAGVGGLSQGDALISFGKDAFCSYGLSQSANAAVSEDMAAAYRAGLNHLLRTSSSRLVGTQVAHWYSGHVSSEEDPMDFLMNAGGENEVDARRRARELLAALREGTRPDLAGCSYYVLTLSGASGRVMLREWLEGPFEELMANVNAWFDDLEIVRRDGQGAAPPPKMAAVLGGLVRDLGDLPAPVAARMWRVAVRREPIPEQFVAQVLGRVRSDVLQDESARHARLGLLRAFHVRDRQGDQQMQPSLNPDHPAPAYHCGRLLAVLARLQRAALGDVGAGVIQRYYAAASVTPGLVLGRLVRTSQFHLNKLEGGLPRWFESQLADILNRLRNDIPDTLDLRQQSLFALGYYHQIAHDRAPKAAANTTAEADADNLDQE